jgi:hypothetical protein
MTTGRRAVALAGAVAILGATQLSNVDSAAAHEISIVLAVAGRSGHAVDGLRLAIDQSPDVGHTPGPDAGDHLGGVDVVLTDVASADASTIQSPLRRAVADGASVAVVIGDTRMVAAAARALTGKQVLLVVAPTDARPIDVPIPTVLLSQGGVADSDAADRFARAFQSTHGRAPSTSAAVGYDIGQFLDILLSTTDGAYPGSAALSASIARAQPRLTATTLERLDPSQEKESADDGGIATPVAMLGGVVVVIGLIVGLVFAARRWTSSTAKP